MLLLTIVANILAGCGAGPTAVAVSAALPTTASPSPRPSPTRIALPTVPAAATSRPVEAMATAHLSPTSSSTPRPSPTATWTSTSTNTPSRTPSATATLTGTPTGIPSATVTPTSTATIVPPATSMVPVSSTRSLSSTEALTGTPTITPSPQFSPTPVPTAAFTQDTVHILLIGGDTDYVLDMNTDTMMVVVIDRKTRQVSLLSIPRDLWVYIPAHGWGRINTAHRIGARFKYPGGGPGLLGRTIEINLGIPIDHWVRISYTGFARVVDELGGVDITVACPVNLRYEAPVSEDEQEMFLQPGVHHLDGATALRYVRTRRNDSDFGRARRQQQFVKAVWDQFKSPDIILKIRALWGAMKDSFQTSMKLGDIVALAPVALDLQRPNVRSRYIGSNQVEGWTTAEGWRVLLPIPEKIQQVVAGLYAPPSAANDRVANEAARIRVQNGTGRPQLALIAADQLRWEGLQLVDTGPADRTDCQKTRIIVFNDKPEALALLTRILQVRPGNVIQQPDPAQPVDIQVILGQDYDPCR